jgi:hypothetical protein
MLFAYMAANGWIIYWKYFRNCMDGSGCGPLENFSDNWQELLKKSAKIDVSLFFAAQIVTVRLHITAQSQRTHRGTCLCVSYLRS